MGLAKAMQAKWLQMQKGETPMVLRKVDAIEDIVRDQLQKVAGGAALDKKAMDLLKKRKLVMVTKSRKFLVRRGACFALERAKYATDLTVEMLQSGEWRDAKFKPYNLSALGEMPRSGAFHPLMKVREQFRQIFLEMGFAEMPTNNFVERRSPRTCRTVIRTQSTTIQRIQFSWALDPYIVSVRYKLTLATRYTFAAPRGRD